MRPAYRALTLKGTSPLLICPSSARTCHRSKCKPGDKAPVFEVSVPGEDCSPISSGRSLPSGASNVSRDLLPSTRELKRSFTETLAADTT